MVVYVNRYKSERANMFVPHQMKWNVPSVAERTKQNKKHESKCLHITTTNREDARS